MKKNVVAARRAVAELARALPDPPASPARTALARRHHDRPRSHPARGARAALDWLVGKYVR